MNNNPSNQGYVYSNGQASRLRASAKNLTVKGTGTGTYQVVGRTLKSDTDTIIGLIDNQTYDITQTAYGNAVYTADVTGYDTVTVQSVSGVTDVYATFTD